MYFFEYYLNNDICFRWDAIGFMQEGFGKALICVTVENGLTVEQVVSKKNLFETLSERN